MNVITNLKPSEKLEKGRSLLCTSLQFPWAVRWCGWTPRQPIKSRNHAQRRGRRAPSRRKDARAQGSRRRERSHESRRPSHKWFTRIFRSPLGHAKLGNPPPIRNREAKRRAGECCERIASDLAMRYRLGDKQVLRSRAAA